MRTKNTLLLFFFVSFSFLSLTQKNKDFEGILKYEIQFVDSVNINNNYKSEMIIYKKNDFVRIETENLQLGRQVMIKNLKLKKLYLLIELNNKKYAIQQHIIDDSIKKKYEFKYKRSSYKFNNVRLRKVIAKKIKNNNIDTLYIYPKIKNNFLDVYIGVKGLPAIYSIYDEYGVYNYNLKEIKENECSLDLFGVPSDYKKISFEDFLKEAMENN